jgi:hypothetical protein
LQCLDSCGQIKMIASVVQSSEIKNMPLLLGVNNAFCSNS